MCIKTKTLFFEKWLYLFVWYIHFFLIVPTELWPKRTSKLMLTFKYVNFKEIRVE